MDAPKCRTCGNRHRLGPCSQDRIASPRAPRTTSVVVFVPPDGGKPVELVGSSDGEGDIGRLLERLKRAAKTASNPIYGEAARAIEKLLRGKPKFDRRAYQREYMRKKRAEQKKS